MNMDNAEYENNSYQLDSSRHYSGSPSYNDDSHQNQQQRRRILENNVHDEDPPVPPVMTNLTSIDPDIQVSRIMTRLKRISIQTLLSDAFHEERNKSFWFTECQLLRIITPGTDGTSKAAVFNRSKSNGKINSTNYQRIFLFREYGINGNQLFYMMVTRDINQALFERNIELRDNGIITIGSYF